MWLYAIPLPCRLPIPECPGTYLSIHIVDTIVVAWTHVPLKIHVPCHILLLFQNKSCGFPSTCFRPGAHPSLWMKVMPPTSETFIHSHRSAPSNASSASFSCFLPFASSVRKSTAVQICGTFPFASHTYVLVRAFHHIRTYLYSVAFLWRILLSCAALARSRSPLWYLCVGVWIVVGCVGD